MQKLIEKINEILKENELELENVEERIKTEDGNFLLGYEFGLHFGIDEILKQIIKEIEK